MSKRFISILLSLAMVISTAFPVNAAKIKTKTVKKSYSLKVNEAKTITTKGDIKSFYIVKQSKKKIKTSKKTDKKGKYKIANSGVLTAKVYNKSANRITIRALNAGNEKVVVKSKKGKTEYKYTIKVKVKKPSTPSRGIMQAPGNPKPKTNPTTTATPKTVPVTGISLSGTSSVKVGYVIQLRSSVSPANATNKSMTYKSSNTSVATVSNTGMVKGINPGTVVISVTSNSNPKASARVTINVTSNTSNTNTNTIKVTKVNASCKSSLYVGDTTFVSATVLPSNATDKTLTYKSSNTGVATVNSQGLVKGVKAGTTTITVSSKSNPSVYTVLNIKVIKKESSGSDSNVPVTGISISGYGTISVGQTEKFTATIKPSNATNKGVIFASSNPSVASVDSNGNVKGLKAGTTIISATSKENSSAVAKVTVTVKANSQSTTDPVSGVKVTGIKVSGYETVKAGDSIQLTTIITPSNASNKKVTYTSSDSSIAKVDQTGKVTGVKAGTTKIKVTSQDNPSVTATKSITVTSASSSVPVTGISISGYETIMVGETAKYTATIKPSNATNKGVTYASSNPSVASVDSNGNVKGLKAGTTIISATSKENSSAVAKVTVTVKENGQSTTDPVGEVRVTGIKISGYETVKAGSSIQLTATVIPSNASNKGVTYTSSNSSIAKVDQTGKVTGVKAGTVKITATSKDNPAATISKNITVTENTVSVTGISISGYSPILVGQTEKYTATIKPSNATNQGVIYASSDPSVATVDANGNVKGLKAGTTVISATSKENSSAVAKVTVTVKENTQSTTDPVDEVHVTGIRVSGPESVKETNSIQLTTVIKPSDATNQKVTYTSSDPSIAKVDQTGKVTGVKVGTTKITITSQDNPTVSVSKSITVTPNTVSVTGIKITGLTKVFEGESEKITVTLTPDNATNKEVVFKSSDTAVATVDADGNVKGIKAGTATITVFSKENSNVSTSLEFTVLKKNFSLTRSSSIPVSGISASGKNELKVGESAPIDVNITPENASNKDVTFSSSDSEIVSVDENGVMTGKKGGTATIYVTSKENENISSSFQVTTIVPVNLLFVVNQTDRIKAGETSQIYATAFPSNATDQGILYYSENEDIATVDENGLITGVSEGTAKIIVASRDGEKKVTVTIEILSNAGPSLNFENLDMKYGSEEIISVKNQGNKSFYWKTSGSNVIKTTRIPGSASMKVEAIGNGHATVQAVFFDVGKVYTCNITVTGKEPKDTPSIPAEVDVKVGEEVSIPISDLPEGEHNIDWDLPVQDYASLGYHSDGKCAYIKGEKVGTTTLTLKLDDTILTTKINVK